MILSIRILIFYSFQQILKQNSSESDNGNQKLSTPEVNTETVTLKSPRRLSKAANTVLTEIFKKIGDKENTKEVILVFK